MRKHLIAAVTAVAVLALGVGIAFAENTYEVDVATTSPAGKGTPAKPLPVKLGFGFEVGETEGLRPRVIEEYKIAPEGLITYAKLFPSCKFAQANTQSSVLPAKCKKAIVGGGLVRNNAGGLTDRTQKLTCNLKLTLVNLSDAGKHGGMAIRVDGDPPAPPPAEVERSVGCTIPVHSAIKAKFVPVKLEGLTTHELRFTLPFELQQPLPGVENAVIDTTSTVLKKTAKTKVKGKTRTVGYYSEIGCKGKSRTLRVLFVDTSGAEFTANKKTKC